MNRLSAFVRRRRLERAIERHLATEYGVYLHWTVGPYTDGTKYQCAYAFQPSPGDPVGRVLDYGTGPTRIKAMFELHHRLKGRPDAFQRLWTRVMSFAERLA